MRSAGRSINAKCKRQH